MTLWPIVRYILEYIYFFANSIPIIHEKIYECLMPIIDYG